METIVPEPLRPYFPMMKGAAVALVILIVGWIASKWANRLTRAAFRVRKLDEALARFIASLVQYAVLAAAIVASLDAVGIHTTSLVAIFASAGIAVGLALQGSLSSFASGVMILFFRPFTLGDKVTIAGHTGVVEDIGLFATTLVTPDNETIIVPNKEATGGSIVNFTTRGTLRGHVVVNVGAGNDVGEVIAQLEKSAKRPKTVLKDPAPAVAFTSVTPRGLELTVHVWSKAADYLDMLHDVRRAITEDLAGSKIAGPTTEVIVHQKPS